MRSVLASVVPVLAMASASFAQVTHAPTFPFIGEAAGDSLGESISGAGDVNNDGFDDLIIGAHMDDDIALNSGLARVISGANGAVLYTFRGEAANFSLGRCVSGAGDVNNDGFDDVIIGVVGDNTTGLSTGSARVYSGADGSLLYTFYGTRNHLSFGLQVSDAGDVNNDGFADIIAGSMASGPNGSGSGLVHVYSGADGSLLHIVAGSQINQGLGVSLSGAGDVNNDGFDDFVIGMTNDFFGDSFGEGSVIVVSGVDGAVLHRFDSDSEVEHFGDSVSGAGDINNDGFDDIIVGAPGYTSDEGFRSGRVYIYSGLDGSALYTIDGDVNHGWFGGSVDSAGDLNGDGVPDFIVGAPLNDTNHFASGGATVFSGIDGSVLYSYLGDDVGDKFGQCVAGAGDLNNDGFADFAISAPNDEVNGNGSGSVRVYLSVALPAGPAPCPGDLTGDGVVNFTDLNGVLSNFGNDCPE